jgi:hypothetical protein
MFMGPMLIPESTAIFAALLAIAVVGVVVGFIWMRRLTEVESEAHVFRSTDPASADPLVTAEHVVREPVADDVGPSLRDEQEQGDQGRNG